MAAGKLTSHRARFRKHEKLPKRRDSPQRQGQSRRRPTTRGRAVRRRAPEPQLLSTALADHIRGLELAMSAVIVSVCALRRQNCDIDEDIARVLERSAADRLDIEIEKLQSLIREARP